MLALIISGRGYDDVDSYVPAEESSKNDEGPDCIFLYTGKMSW